MGMRWHLVKRTSNVTELYTLADSYDMPSEPVDAMNVEAVHEAVAVAATRARAGRSQRFWNQDYRYKATPCAPQNTVEEEVEEYKGRDPSNRLRKNHFGKKNCNRKDLEAIEQKSMEVEESVKFRRNPNTPTLRKHCTILCRIPLSFILD